MQDTTNTDEPAAATRTDVDVDGTATGERTRSRPIDDPSVHARRAAVYGYIAATFQYPDETVLDDLRDPDVTEAVTDAARTIAALDPSAESLPPALADFERSLAATSNDDLRAAYNALFGLPGEDGSYPVVAYEADYTTTGDVNETQRRIATIVGLLERFDLEPHDDFDERQDHVAVLLELMQVAALQRATALDAGRTDEASALADAEATILDEHLVSFVPALANDVEDVTGASRDRSDCGERPRADADEPSAVDPPDVYHAAADLAAALVRWDASGRPEPAIEPADGPTGDSA